MGIVWYIIGGGVFITLVAILAFKVKNLAHIKRENKLRRAKLQRELEEIKDDID